MKKQLIPVAVGVFLLAICLLSCKEHDVAQSVQIFKVGQEPATLSYKDLQRDQDIFVFKSPLDDGPGTDETGAKHSLDKQPRPDVVFIVGTFGGRSERSLVIPRDRYIFANILSSGAWYYDDDACDPNFQPAPGQSMLDFLKSATPDLKTTGTLSVVLNGQELVTKANREEFYVETEVYPFRPHKDFDFPDCDYSAKTAKAYSVGYSMLMKLPPGSHTLLVKSSHPATVDADAFESEVLWHLTVQ